MLDSTIAQYESFYRRYVRLLTPSTGAGYNYSLVVENRRQMLTIGLTGGIGTGKSEAAGNLARLGAVVLNADNLGHAVYQSGEPAFDKIVGIFGSMVVGSNGEIDRKRLGEIVFDDPEKRQCLEAIVWPAIRKNLLWRIQIEREKGTAPAVVIEAALLYRAGWESLCDEIWEVVAPCTQVVERLRARSGMSETEARRRIRAQTSEREPGKQPTVTIVNNGDREELARYVESLWNKRVASKEA